MELILVGAVMNEKKIDRVFSRGRECEQFKSRGIFNQRMSPVGSLLWNCMDLYSFDYSQAIEFRTIVWIRLVVFGYLRASVECGLEFIFWSWKFIMRLDREELAYCEGNEITMLKRPLNPNLQRRGGGGERRLSDELEAALSVIFITVGAHEGAKIWKTESKLSNARDFDWVSYVIFVVN